MLIVSSVQLLIAIERRDNQLAWPGTIIQFFPTQFFFLYAEIDHLGMKNRLYPPPYLSCQSDERARWMKRQIVHSKRPSNHLIPPTYVIQHIHHTYYSFWIISNWTIQKRPSIFSGTFSPLIDDAISSSYASADPYIRLSCRNSGGILWKIRDHP